MEHKPIKIITNKAPLPLGPYNQGFKYNNYMLTAGQIPIDPISGIIPEDIEKQTILTLNHIRSIIQSAGFKIKNIVKTTVFLINLNDITIVNQCYEKFFLQYESDFPARTCIEVSRLPKDVKIEIEAIAIK